MTNAVTLVLIFESTHYAQVVSPALDLCKTEGLIKSAPSAGNCDSSGGESIITTLVVARQKHLRVN